MLRIHKAEQEKIDKNDTCPLNQKERLKMSGTHNGKWAIGEYNTHTAYGKQEGREQNVFMYLRGFCKWMSE